MRKLAVIALALFTLNGVAQENRKTKMDHKEMSKFKKEMTPEDRANLKSKRMTLALDLSDDQQQQVYNVLFAQARTNKNLRTEKKALKEETKSKPSKDEFVKTQNDRLDQQIELKRKMKGILTAEQYEKLGTLKPKAKRRKEHKKSN